ncbi:MAG: sensor histidine kinase [Flavobacteriaceae bacterium]
MILSIFGIVGVQAFWIVTSWENKEEEFSLAINQTLQSVAREIQNRELSDYIAAYQQLIDSVGKPTESNFTDVFLFMDDDKPNNLSTFFAFGILEEDYNIQRGYFDPVLGQQDSTTLKDYKGVRTTTILKRDVFNRENRLTSSIQKLKRIDRLSSYDEAKYRDAYMDYANTLPIHRRINNQEVATLLELEFQERDIQIPYQFGIYNDGLGTKIKSLNYQETQEGAAYNTPVFLDQQGNSPYELRVTFPSRDRYVMSSIFGVAGLSLVLTLFIISVSAGALYQIIRQKKISEIKTDFINNMSHEFKTPIATINLALDAIANPKTIAIPSKILQYTNMIREENTRMLTQVENVLKISQLERGTTLLEWERLHLNELIAEAVNHVTLIVENKKGYIRTHLKANEAYFKGDFNHFTNLIINILDNAIKYTDGAPEIDIFTQQQGKLATLIIQDKGMGMDAATQRMVFEKFYRQEGGNVHNIKGHGLGLSYVKKIIELHHCKINVESKKGEGSRFIITIPLQPQPQTAS